MDRSRKKWIDNVKGCLKKMGFDVRQARRMVHDGNGWRGFVRGNAWGALPRGETFDFDEKP